MGSHSLCDLHLGIGFNCPLQEQQSQVRSRGGSYSGSTVERHQRRHQATRTDRAQRGALLGSGGEGPCSRAALQKARVGVCWQGLEGWSRPIRQIRLQPGLRTQPWRLFLGGPEHQSRLESSLWCWRRQRARGQSVPGQLLGSGSGGRPASRSSSSLAARTQAHFASFSSFPVGFDTGVSIRACSAEPRTNTQAAAPRA